MRTRSPALRTLPTSTYEALGLLADVAHAALGALEAERHVARDDGQRRDLAEVGDDVLGDAVGEVLLLRVAAHVGERQHADGDLGPAVRGRLSRRRASSARRAWPPAPCRARGRRRRSRSSPQSSRSVVCTARKSIGSFATAEAHRDQRAAVGGIARLAAHPARVDRAGRPDDDDRARALELAGDQRVEFLAGRDLGIPPDGPALGLERGHERRHENFVVACVRDEDVGQRVPRLIAVTLT